MDKTLTNYKGHTSFFHTHFTNGVERWRCYKRYGKRYCRAFNRTKGDEIIFIQLNLDLGQVNNVPKATAVSHQCASGTSKNSEMSRAGCGLNLPQTTNKSEHPQIFFKVHI